MLDPILSPPTHLITFTEPYISRLQLSTLPHHIHEVLFAALLYQTVQSVISPLISTYLFPHTYKNLTRRTRINWDVHVVSLVQSLLINTLALYVMFNDNERYEMKHSVVERVFGYTGASGLVQALACGYFMWDLVVSTRYFKVFGIGIWAHAVTALCVFSFGFRPFANYYGPVFILYELSSPFLNVHWFCDKLNMTGSKLQWYNGMILLFTFFCCRLVWGTYQSVRVYYDVWQILQMDDPVATFRQGIDVRDTGSAKLFDVRNGQMCLGDKSCLLAQSEVMKFMGPDSRVPYWLIAIYVVSNLTLNALNWFWFGKMIETLKKRFDEKPGDEKMPQRASDGHLIPPERRKSVVEYAADTLDREVLTGPVTPGNELTEKMAMSRGMSSGIDGGSEINKRRKDI